MKSARDASHQLFDECVLACFARCSGSARERDWRTDEQATGVVAAHRSAELRCRNLQE